MNVLDLFSGIGGFSLGLERAGMTTVAFCEIEEYPRKVLKKHWPNVLIYEDVRDVSKERLESDGITGIDIVTGGFPCTDISVAGNQAGIGKETRSGLWSELCRIIGDIRPRYAIVENVTALISGDNGRWFGKILGDLAEIGYDAEWHCISASELGAHHHRDRVWIVAHAEGERRGEAREFGSRSEKWSAGTSTTFDNVANTNSTQRKRNGGPIGILAEYADFSGGSWWDIEPELGRVANGIPKRMDRLKGLGNAVVPQIPELIGRAIMEIERDHQN